VPREANVDADRLSHPAEYQAVHDEAAAAFGPGRVHRARFTQADWDGLRTAVAMGVQGPKRRKH
jgi:hypothetical protein